jgi:hypothetical protein
MTNVEQVRPLKDAGRLPTDRGRSTGHVLLVERFVAADLRRLRGRRRAAFGGTGLDNDHTFTFVSAINECLTNAVRHGGGHAGSSSSPRTARCRSRKSMATALALQRQFRAPAGGR